MAQAVADTAKALIDKRAEHLENLAKLIEASLIGYAEDLRRGQVRISPADLQRLHKLWQEITEELGAPTAASANGDPHAATGSRTPEHTAAVITALRDSGALAALRLRAADEPAVNT
jgi:hypothetical protein